MTQLDLDTAELGAAGRRAGDTAALLAGLATEHADAHDAARAAGDPVLAVAITDLFGAWAPVHRTLVAALEELAAGLRRATELYASAEGTTADGFVRAMLDLPAGDTAGRPAEAPAGGPLTDRAV